MRRRLVSTICGVCVGNRRRLCGVTETRAGSSRALASCRTSRQGSRCRGTRAGSGRALASCRTSRQGSTRRGMRAGSSRTLASCRTSRQGSRCRGTRAGSSRTLASCRTSRQGSRCRGTRAGRSRTLASCRTGRPLGDETLMERLESAAGRALKPQKRGPKPKQKNYVVCPRNYRRRSALVSCPMFVPCGLSAAGR